MGIVSPNYQAVIFDLDGTLLDTIEDIAGATNRVLEVRGLAPFSVEETKLLVGDGIEEMIRRTFALRGIGTLSDTDVAGIVTDYRREYQSCWRSHSRPYPGVSELLDELLVVPVLPGKVLHLCNRAERAERHLVVPPGATAHPDVHRALEVVDPLAHVDEVCALNLPA